MKKSLFARFKELTTIRVSKDVTDPLLIYVILCMLAGLALGIYGGCK